MSTTRKLPRCVPACTPSDHRTPNKRPLLLIAPLGLPPCFSYPALWRGFAIHSALLSFPLAFLLAVCQYIDMICPNCFHTKTTVTNSRGNKTRAATWRRRRCAHCQTDFTTYELPSLDNQPVLGRDREQRSFCLGKLIVSISRCFQHDPDRAGAASYHLAQTIEQHLILQTPSPSVDDIAAITHTALQRYDAVAAIQYAAQHDLLSGRRRPGRPSLNYSRRASSPADASSPQLFP